VLLSYEPASVRHGFQIAAIAGLVSLLWAAYLALGPVSEAARRLLCFFRVT
jgi:hypothetical protein